MRLNFRGRSVWQLQQLHLYLTVLVLSILHGNSFNWILMIGYSSGDMAGQIVLLLLLIALMKINRKLSKFI